MTANPNTREQPTRALVALARMDLHPDPAYWPLADFGGRHASSADCTAISQGFAAAAIVTDRVDLLPEQLADPVTAWTALEDPFRGIIRQRNPAMAIYCEHTARGDRA